MDALIEAIIDLFEKNNMPHAAAYGAGLLVMYLILNFSYKQYQRWRTKKLQNHLRPSYLDNEVAAARRYYIETQCQDTAPSIKDELTENSPNTEPIIRFFLKRGFANLDEAKFYLVLGGSGTGKTTFMINLILRYRSQLWGRKHDIRLFPIKDPDTFPQIEKIIEEGKAADTILLLDALDEDRKAAVDFEGRMNEICYKVKDFKEVVITCRTQFIPSEDRIPGEVQVPRHGPEGGFHKLNTKYISPFDKEEVHKYLGKKYGRFPLKNRKKKKEAKTIVERSPKLMVRPMLLANIDALLEDGISSYAYTYQIYERMVEKWIDREAMRKEEKKREVFRKELIRFSHRMAQKIYDKWLETGLLSLSAKEVSEMRELDEDPIDLEEVEMTNKSLLNRDAEGNIKFAHKSILEFLLAKNLNGEYKKISQMKFAGMDMLEFFFREMDFLHGVILDMVEVEGNSFFMGEGEKEGFQATVSAYKISRFLVTQGLWEFVMGNNPSNFKNGPLYPVESVSWPDCQEFLSKINEKTHLNFRLPTEVEWENAARGGKLSKGFQYSGSNDLDEVGWYRNNSKGKTQPVGQLKPNELGLFDMSGNVREWCQDWYGDYPASPQDNYKGLFSGADRVIRGGCWIRHSGNCRVSNRSFNYPRFRDFSIGFRLALSPESVG